MTAEQILIAIQVLRELDWECMESLIDFMGMEAIADQLNTIHKYHSNGQ